MLEGLPPHRPTHVLRLITDEPSARAMTELLGEMFDPMETAVAAFEVEETGAWRLEAYFSEEPDAEMIRELIRPVLGAQADEAVFETIDQQDWVRASLEGLKPVRAGRFLVHGGHDRHQVRGNDLAIEIEAALAFGTGHHGTTLGCLRALGGRVEAPPSGPRSRCRHRDRHPRLCRRQGTSHARDRRRSRSRGRDHRPRQCPSQRARSLYAVLPRAGCPPRARRPAPRLRPGLRQHPGPPAQAARALAHRRRGR
jgi:hypothetical protein